MSPISPTTWANDPTATERGLIEEAAGLIVWCRAQRVLLLTGGKFEVQPYTTAVNSLRRLLVDLGLEQRLTDVTPSLEEYIAQKTRAKATASATDAEVTDG